MTTVQMSQDIHSQAASFLRDRFQDNINEDDLKQVTAWISDKLEEERQGWRKKVQMSFKEVEKERKLGLSTQSSIQRIIGLFDPYLEPLYLYREPSQYHSSDEDTRIGNVERLEKNIQAILRMLDSYQEERIECVHYLNITDPEVQLAEVVRKRVSRLEQQLSKTDDEWKETEQRLLKEIQTSNEALDMQTQLNNDQKDKTGREVAEMRRLLTDLETQVKGVPSFGQRKCANKGSQVNFVRKKPTRDCCIQVSLDLTVENCLERNKNLLQEWDEKAEGKKVDIMDLRPPSEHGSTQTGISSITIVKQRGNNKNGRQPVSRFQQDKALTPIMHTRGEAIVASSNQLSSQTDFEKSMYPVDPESFSESDSNQQTISHLRNQVVDFATKLVTAKQQVNQYHENLTLKKGKPNVHFQNNDQDTARTNYTSRSIYDFRHDQLKGFLSGIKVKDGTQSARDHKKSIQSDSQKPIRAMLSYSGTAKCLRCNQLYKTKENMDTSCKFHSKNKIKFEKYDPSGKLKKVVQLWECCMKGSEFEGCQLGQHI